MTSALKLFGATAAMALVVGQASAASAVFDFSNLTWNGTSNVGFLPTDGVKCTGGDLCSSNVNNSIFNNDLTFVSGAVTAKATGYYNNNLVAVVQDHKSGNELGAGLGVYHKLDNSDDNITVGEKLKMSFSQVVNLSSINLRAEGHGTVWSNNAVFQYSQDGSNWITTKLVGTLGLNLTGKEFYFKYGDGDNDRSTAADQFYLAGMTVTAVPEPETYAMMLAGLGLMGTIARRRKAKSA